MTQVPDTNTFSLADVCDVLGLQGSDRNLQNCFNVADDNFFDSNYKGNKDRLSNFRNYTPISLSIEPALLSIAAEQYFGEVTVTFTNISNLVKVSTNAAWISILTSNITSSPHTRDFFIGSNTSIHSRSGSITFSLTNIVTNETLLTKTLDITQAGTFAPIF